MILKFDGQSVETMRGLPRAVASTPIGKTVVVDLLRKGENMTVNVTVGRLPEDAEAEVEDSDSAERAGAEEAPVEETLLGLSIAPLTEALREQYGIGKSIEGVVVTEVDPASPAAQKDVKPGDVIVEVTQTKVKDPQEVMDRVAAIKKSGTEIRSAPALRRQRRPAFRRRPGHVGRLEPNRSNPHRRADRERQERRCARASPRGFGGTIINANSMQVYSELRVLTARPSESEEAIRAASDSMARCPRVKPIPSAAGSTMWRTRSKRRTQPAACPSSSAAPGFISRR